MRAKSGLPLLDAILITAELAIAVVLCSHLALESSRLVQRGENVLS